MSHMAEYTCCSSVAFERPNENTFTLHSVHGPGFPRVRHLRRLLREHEHQLVHHARDGQQRRGHHQHDRHSARGGDGHDVAVPEPVDPAQGVGMVRATGKWSGERVRGGGMASERRSTVTTCNNHLHRIRPRPPPSHIKGRTRQLPPRPTTMMVTASPCSPNSPTPTPTHTRHTHTVHTGTRPAPVGASPAPHAHRDMATGRPHRTPYPMVAMVTSTKYWQSRKESAVSRRARDTCRGKLARSFSNTSINDAAMKVMMTTARPML
jgi:hypothetical protein